jgi:hypothetical protein
MGRLSHGRWPAMQIRGRGMLQQNEHQPGMTVPATGNYELRNVFGSRTGSIGEFSAGQTLPAAPRGWFWSLVPREAYLESGD